MSQTGGSGPYGTGSGSGSYGGGGGGGSGAGGGAGAGPGQGYRAYDEDRDRYQAAGASNHGAGHGGGFSGGYGNHSDLNHDTTQPDTETLLRRVVEIIGNAKSMPLSNSVIISKDEVLELLDDAIERLPPELQQARWMLKEREEYIARVKRDGEEILEAARVRAERMVQRTEIVRQAQHTAERVSQQARDEASRLRLEAEDYCDQKLAAFEIVLERTMKQVQAGRERLRVTPLPPAEVGDLVGELSNDMAGAFGSRSAGSRAAGPGVADDGDEGFFDQDRK